jgi:hypothetical protein
MPVHRTKKSSKPSRHRSKGHHHKSKGRHHRSKGYHHRSKSISQKTYKNLKMSTPSTIDQDKLHQLVNMIKLQRKGITKSKTNLAARLNDLRKTPMHPQQHMQIPLSMPMYPQQHMQMPMYPQQHMQMPMHHQHHMHHHQQQQPMQLMMIKSNSNMKGTSPRRHKIIKMKFPVTMTMPMSMSMKTGNPKVKKYSQFVQRSYAAINKNGQKEEYGQKVETDSTTPFFEVTKVHNDHVDHFHIPK